MIGGIGMQELLVILVIALVIFGGKKLPEIGSNLGKAIRGFKESAEKVHEEPQRRVKGSAEPPVKEAQTGPAAMEDDEGEDAKKAS